MFSYEVNIVCDDYDGRCPNKQACETSEPVASAFEGRKKVIAYAKSLGWMMYGNIYCPDCAKNLKEDIELSDDGKEL
jgi:hypothetical protein